jgi:hypothetical protein
METATGKGEVHIARMRGMTSLLIAARSA